MIDYGNGMDIPISSPIVYQEILYFLSLTTYNGYLFSYFPIDESQIDIKKIKEHSHLLKSSKVSSLSAQIYWSMFQNLSNLDEQFKEFICILWRMSETQIAIIQFNTTNYSFERTPKFTTDSSFYISNLYFYNSTLAYIWGDNIDGQSHR